MLDHYLHTALAGARLLHPHRDTVDTTPAAPDVVVEALADLAAALAWFKAEQQVLTGAIDQAASTGFAAHAWQLAWSMANYLDRQGPWPDWADVATQALAGAIQLGDPWAQADAHRNLARALIRLGEHEPARTHVDRALDLFGTLRDDVGAAHSQLILSAIDERQGRPADALAHARCALDLFERVGHVAGQGNALNSVGWYLGQLGDHAAALEYCTGASPCSNASATATNRPPPGTASASPSATSAGSPTPPTATGDRSRCGGVSAIGSARPTPPST